MIATLWLGEERNPLAMAGQRRFEKERERERETIANHVVCAFANLRSSPSPFVIRHEQEPNGFAIPFSYPGPPLMIRLHHCRLLEKSLKAKNWVLLYRYFGTASTLVCPGLH